MALTLGGLVGILIAILILAILLYAVHLIMSMLPIDQNIKSIAWLVIAVIVLLVVLQLFIGGIHL